MKFHQITAGLFCPPSAISCRAWVFGILQVLTSLLNWAHTISWRSWELRMTASCCLHRCMKPISHHPTLSFLALRRRRLAVVSVRCHFYSNVTAHCWLSWNLPVRTLECPPIANSTGSTFPFCGRVWQNCTLVMVKDSRKRRCVRSYPSWSIWNGCLFPSFWKVSLNGV